MCIIEAVAEDVPECVVVDIGSTGEECQPMNEIRHLLDVMAQLRNPENGCPWDLLQTPSTIAPYAIEEACEVQDAIEQNDSDALEEELGDLLLQVVYQSQLASEEGKFDFQSVTKRITEKMIRRHPHVFGGADYGGAAWEDGKEKERKAKSQSGILAGIPDSFPALTRARKLASRAARVGFDWPDVEGVVGKVREELLEVEAEIASGDRVALKDEIGDLLFAAASLARRLEIDPEDALRGANRKFTRRFEAVEKKLAHEGESVAEQSVEKLDALWCQVKAAEKSE
jgi:ATP diphosphatase